MSFQDAREAVLREVQAAYVEPSSEQIGLDRAHIRILAADVHADRDYPPFNRSARDGFALRAHDAPGTLRVIGESRAGAGFSGAIRAGEAVEIMTGAPVPDGADAVVMVEHCVRPSDDAVTVPNPIDPGANISVRGCEALAGSVVLSRGSRIEYPAVALLAAAGHTTVSVYRRPRVAIVATGDEIVEITEQPAAHQIRNSNTWSLAAQVARAGAIPVVMPIARDSQPHTRGLIESALADADLLVLSGGVSAGKYDVVELALAELGAKFFFDRVKIQPGQPLVFGRAKGKFFFGLPGNPLSTMVTFELFARLAIDVLSGCSRREFPFLTAKLTVPFRQKPGLTRILPAIVDRGGLTPVPWQGSADVGALCRANAFLVTDPDRTSYEPGDEISVLLK
ncbi:MAG: molybdopterin molybdotransferase MoeA [Acidobacteriota bacterium]|nr:molybdopterin molybdotransferase MoeA [Acidobacteriota bacterium]